MAIRRRTVLTGAAALAGLAACRQDTAAGALADAHVHLFNGADLPAGRFAQYVALPDLFPDLPPFVGALADLALNVLQQFARPASAEAVRTGNAFSTEPDVVSAEAFGRAVEARIQAVGAAERGLVAGGPTSPLADSYRALTDVLAADPAIAAQAPPGLAPPASRAEVAARARDVLSAVAAREASLAPAPLPAPSAVPAAAAAQSTISAQRVVGWIFQMLQSRQHHLARYLAQYAPGGQPRLLINHLVDYRYWLGEGPRPGSETAQQVAFWARVAAARKDRVDLRTFAPFCPLRHAIEVAAGQPLTLDTLKADHAAGRIAGVKLYPPMGFQPVGNARIKDGWTGPGGLNGEFTSAPGEGLGRTAVDAWEAVAGKVALGPALDSAMAAVLAWARAADVPMMAHAGYGNSPAPAFRTRANPVWWEQAAGPNRDLRVSLGHLVKTPEDFIAAGEAYASGRPLDTSKPGNWAFDAPIRMLRPVNGQPGRAYADLAYMPGLAGDAPLAARFCRTLKATFGQADPDLRQILYGTDWIMFALEAESAAFPETLRRGMTDAGFSTAAIENIAWKNARRFLKLEAA